MDADEHDEYGWFTFAEAYERIRWTDDREALEQIWRRVDTMSARLAAEPTAPAIAPSG